MIIKWQCSRFNGSDKTERGNVSIAGKNALEIINPRKRYVDKYQNNDILEVTTLILLITLSVFFKNGIARFKFI